MAIITAAGRGARLAPVADVIPKAFLPVSVRTGYVETSLSRLLRQTVQAGFDRIVVAGTGHPWFRGLPGVHAVVEPPQDGEWNAVRQAAPEVADDAAVVVISADNVFSDRDFANFVSSNTTTSIVAISWVENSSGLSVVEIEGTNVVAVWEKPSYAPPGFGKAGLYRFAPESFRTLVRERVEPDRFGEISLTQALQRMLEMRLPVTGHVLQDCFYDIGTVEGWAAAISGLASLCDEK